MSETDQSITQKQGSLIWVGLQSYRKLSDWTMAAKDHRLQGNRPEAMSQERARL